MSYVKKKHKPQLVELCSPTELTMKQRLVSELVDHGDWTLRRWFDPSDDSWLMLVDAQLIHLDIFFGGHDFVEWVVKLWWAENVNHLPIFWLIKPIKPSIDQEITRKVPTWLPNISLLLSPSSQACDSAILNSLQVMKWEAREREREKERKKERKKPW